MAGHHEAAVPLPKAKSWSGKAGFGVAVALYMIGVILYFFLSSPAFVNGQPITEQQIKDHVALFESLGNQVDSKQIAQLLVQERVILKAANERGIRATKEEINKEIENFLQSLKEQGQGQEFNPNANRKALEAQFNFQLVSDKYFTQVISQEGFNPQSQNPYEQQMFQMIVQNKVGELMRNSNILFNVKG